MRVNDKLFKKSCLESAAEETITSMWKDIVPVFFLKSR